MQTRCNRKDRRRHGARTLLAPLVVAILLGAAPSNPVLSGPSAAVASQSGSGGGGP
jgi:hypothetical protein